MEYTILTDDAIKRGTLAPKKKSPFSKKTKKKKPPKQRKKRIRYKEYILSKDWENRRKMMREYFKGNCVLCNRRSVFVHHRSYKHLGQPNEPQDLVPLCKECHYMFHAHFDYNKENHSFEPRLETIRNFREYSNEVIIDKLKELS
jgi:hypothetical protein